ncbi:hypothetical protein LA345_36730 (plasmid) [Burkholderia vietnamiensis]|uniref:Uncharacterized protein n=1 Tax=Burkholderia vietnamiensis (strain G4 / LMG 22486) TaxID=269482 RepID=A4JVW7_BURVG|nr:hypothetical protein Bcep1808_7545 [Burkholderia vietnamiensis G4]MCB4349359.1 hypothetical protein [Burkholderia vietnamiensis]
MFTISTPRDRLERSLPFMSAASAEACELVLAGKLTGLNGSLRDALARTVGELADQLVTNGNISISNLLRLVALEATAAHPPEIPGGEQNRSNFARTLFEHLYGLLTVCRPH